MLRCNHVLLSKCLVYGKVYNKCVFEAQICWGCWWYFLSTQSGWRLQDVEKWGRFPAGFSINKWEIHWEKGELAHQQLWFYAVKKNADCQQTSSTKNMIDWEIWYSTTGNPSFGLKFRTFDSRGMKMSTTNERNPWNFILKKLCLVFVLESSHWFIHWLHPFQYYAYNYIYIYIVYT